MCRRLLYTFYCLLLGAVAALALLPWWLGPAVKWAGRSHGVDFDRYERISYARFAIHGAEFSRPGLKVKVSRLEAVTPVVWLWQRWTGRPAAVVAERWTVDAGDRPSPASEPGIQGWPPLRAILQRVAEQLALWLPQAQMGPGIVRFPGGEIALASAGWSDAELKVQGLTYRSVTLDAVLTFIVAQDLARVRITSVSGAAVPFAASLESQDSRVSGEITAWGQTATVDTRFDPRGWLPATASLQAPAWSIAGEVMKLGGWYLQVSGAAQIDWREGRFTARINADGTPLPAGNAPPLKIDLRGQGDPEAFTIESLQISMPGISARITDSVTIGRNGEVHGPAARFSFQADLAEQPWFSSTGSVAGEARLVSALGAPPVVEFSVDARQVRARDVNVPAIAARGQFEWPRVSVTEGRLVGGEGEELRIRGAYDFRLRRVTDAVVEGAMRRSSVARWLPQQPEFDAATVFARFDGTIEALQHSGRVQASDVTLRGLKPLAVAVAWRGNGVRIEEVDVEAKAGATVVSATGQVEADALRLTRLDIVRDGAPSLRLASPTTVRWRPQLQIEALQMAGGESRIELSTTFGAAGRIQAAVRGISPLWFADLVSVPGPTWDVVTLGLEGAWDRGPMTFALEAELTVGLGEGRAAAVALRARGERDGITVEALRASESSTPIFEATGRVPLTLSPGETPLFQFAPRGGLRLEAAVEPGSFFWEKFAVLSGVELRKPEATVRLAGTWQDPTGTVRVKADRISVDPKRNWPPLPLMEGLELKLAGDRSGIAVQNLSVRIEDQAVTAHGRLTLAEEDWSRLSAEPLAVAKRGAAFRIDVADAEVAALARFLPAMLAPKGRLQAQLEYQGGVTDGFLRLTDAASRPLGPLGVLQEINADLAVSNRTLVLRRVTARSGGQPVSLTGTIELPDVAAPAASLVEAIRFDLALQGDNLPFVRQTGLLLRGDLDLKLKTAAGMRPRLSGRVKLRDSLFLSDVRDLLPKGGTASPSRRPPYFAVETKPVNAWELAIDVTGDKFLRLRTPVFNGVTSARFRLGGTLGEPRAVGEVVIEEGSVRMPFASFEVTQGHVRLSEADPYEPTIFLRAGARRYGYDLTMELDGRASQPNVAFGSTPSLDSEQVLLMVMTGAAPGNEVSKSTTQRAASIGYFLGANILSGLGSDPGDADRLSISSGEKISRQGKETYDIQYKLLDRVTLTGEYNEFDEYAAGVKWRVFGGKQSEETDRDAAPKK